MSQIHLQAQLKLSKAKTIQQSNVPIKLLVMNGKLTVQYSTTKEKTHKTHLHSNCNITNSEMEAFVVDIEQQIK